MSQMAPPSSTIRFIDTALSCVTAHALSYADPDQKWIIRQHLISLLQNYPTLSPSIDTFNHNNGLTVNLLKAFGNLHISNSTPPIPITIWLHQNYPFASPLVFVSISNGSSQIHPDHPFVDPSGSVANPYLLTWLHSKSNLSDLVKNLVKLFSYDHPFDIPYNSSTSSSSLSFRTHPSKMEALDKLSGALHYDLVALTSKTEQEIEELSKLQIELLQRDDIITSLVLGLEHESLSLEGKVMEMVKAIDVLTRWLNDNNYEQRFCMAGYEIDDDDYGGFENVDEKSKMLIDCLGADRGIEDLMYALDKAVEQGVVSFEEYIKQVRKLARQQFSYRDNLYVNREEHLRPC